MHIFPSIPTHSLDTRPNNTQKNNQAAAAAALGQRACAVNLSAVSLSLMVAVGVPRQADGLQFVAGLRHPSPESPSPPSPAPSTAVRAWSDVDVLRLLDAFDDLVAPRVLLAAPREAALHAAALPPPSRRRRRTALSGGTQVFIRAL